MGHGRLDLLGRQRARDVQRGAVARADARAVVVEVRAGERDPVAGPHGRQTAPMAAASLGRETS